MQETQVQFLCQEDPLEKEMAAHSNILAWRILWTEEPSGLYSPWGRKGLDTIEQLSMCKHLGKAEGLSKSISPLTECSKKSIISNPELKVSTPRLRLKYQVQVDVSTD